MVEREVPPPPGPVANDRLERGAKVRRWNAREVNDAKAAEAAAEKASKFGVKEIDVRVKGPGSGRESAIRALQASGLEVKAIEDCTPLPHNGCRPRKKRRV